MITVLIVEDDPMVAFVNEQYLKKTGDIEVIGPVWEENKIISILDEFKVDLILLDVFLPKKSGLEILKALREKKYLVDVIVVSAANSAEELRKAFAYGAVDYLIKPFQYERFEESINKYKRRHELLNKDNYLEQKDIDNCLVNNNTKLVDLPKGLNKLTLDKIIKFLEENIDKVWTLREIASELSLSNVTIKKYMDYLEEVEKVEVEIAYGNVGRPEYKYTIKNIK